MHRRTRAVPAPAEEDNRSRPATRERTAAGLMPFDNLLFEAASEIDQFQDPKWTIWIRQANERSDTFARSDRPLALLLR